jgi:Tol biopolymer transport system component
VFVQALIAAAAAVTAGLPPVEFNPRISPTGTAVLFQRERPSTKKTDEGPIVTDWVARIDGRRLSRLPAETGDYAWSPDGRRIAWASVDAHGARGAIHVAGANGKKARRLTWSNALDAHPVWSPDGRLIAWMRISGNRSRVWVMRPDGTGAHPLLSRRLESGQPAWSPDGTQLAFLGCRAGGGCAVKVGALYVARADGSSPRRITSSGTVYGPKWSPDGRRIAFVYAGSTSKLAVATADGSQQAVLVRSRLGLNFAWSPDGRRLAYDGGTPSRVRLVGVRGGPPRLLLDGEVGTLEDFLGDWSRDGRWIALTHGFPSGRRVGSRVELVHPDGSGRRRLLR